MGCYLDAEGERRELLNVQQAEAGTRVVAPSLCTLPSAARGKVTTRVEKASSPGTVLSCAVQLAREGRSVAAVSAASAYHVGGGFSTGGRHALEEAFCMQTTLYPCLQSVWRTTSRSRGDRYIPPEAAVLCPGVEVFRDGSAAGYEPLPEPVALSCVVSVAMPNLNPRVVDAPTDSFAEPRLYDAALRDRWRAALYAASLTDATDVVVPDAGCGVYQNQPQAVGAALSQVIATDFPDRFDTVWVVGSNAFFAAASAPPPEASPSRFSAASQLKAKVLRKPASKQPSVSCVREDEEEGPPSAASSPLRTLPLSETNLRRWLSKSVRKSGSKRSILSTTVSSASSVRSGEDSDQCSGTLGGYTASNAGSVLQLADGQHDSRDGLPAGSLSPLPGSAPPPAGQDAAELAAALLAAAAQREDVRLAQQAPPVPPPRSYTDQPGAEWALRGVGLRCPCPSPRPPVPLGEPSRGGERWLLPNVVAPHLQIKRPKFPQELGDDSPAPVVRKSPKVPQCDTRHRPGLFFSPFAESVLINL